MKEINQATQNLILKYDLWQKSLNTKEHVKTIHVDEVASKVAAFYEQIRTVIDWKEEHLMRRAAIIRKLKRRFMDIELNDFSGENIAEPLVLELIRGGYFPNDRIEESKILEVKKIIEKYVFVLKNNPESKKGKAGIQFYTWLIEVASCEIEETLSPSIKEMGLIDYMFVTMRERIKIDDIIYKKNLLKEEEKDIQIYIAVQQALFKLDSPIISYNLIKYKYSSWESPGSDQLLEISQNIYKVWNGIKYDLFHILSKKFYAICEKYDTSYLLLGDILSTSNLEKISEELHDPSALEHLIRGAYQKRLLNLKAKIKRAAIYSTASIFITKILSLIILEIILAKIISGGHLNFSTLAADILIPTILMTLLVVSVSPPSKKNLSLIIMETMKIVYQQDSIDTYEIKIAKRKSVMTRLFLSLIYLICTIASFGFIFWVFYYFEFPITSIIINFVFIALILFAGTAVRKRSQELTVEDENEGILGFIYDILFLPIMDVGRWLSNTWKQYNAIAAFFNALIDMPFSAFIEFLERWRYFIKEKKEEMR